MFKPPILILHAPGTNRDEEAAVAVSAAGGQPHIVSIEDLRAKRGAYFAEYAAVLLPGGFSYGDALGAGTRLALSLSAWFSDSLMEMIERGRPILGICNGFQALVRLGMFNMFRQSMSQSPDTRAPDTHNAMPPDMSTSHNTPSTSSTTSRNLSSTTTSRNTLTSRDAYTDSAHMLTTNIHGRFECRWVTIRVEPHCKSSWLTPIQGEIIRCPVAHAEGRFVVSEPSVISQLDAQGQVAFRYMGGLYPANPNGSEGDVAGLCDSTGYVVGLMPHPEDHIVDWQRPSGEAGARGSKLFEALVSAAK